jgi:hypothetical protein
MAADNLQLPRRGNSNKKQPRRCRDDIEKNPLNFIVLAVSSTDRC